MIRRTWRGRWTILAAALLLAPVAAARADLIFPALSYRSGPYASGGSAFADGFEDYFTLLNERDGGINGVRIQVPECDTGYNSDRGAECYEAIRGLNPLLIQPLSTSLAARILPRASADGVPVLSMGHGRAAFADASVFRWAFNFPAHAWDAATIIVEFMRSEAGGSLAGRRIALVHLNSPYGQEPIPIFRELARKHRFGLRVHAVDHPGQEQKAVWERIAAEAPDFVALWGWGIMSRIALEEALRVGFPAGRIIGNWGAATDAEILDAGAGAEGYRALLFHRTGRGFPLYEDLQKYVYDTGKAAGNGANAGTAHYNSGLYAAVLAAEAARTAMRRNDTTEITPAMMRDGLEALRIDKARMQRLGLPEFAPEIALSCTDHGGPGRAAIYRWDAQERAWRQVTDFLEPDRELLEPLIRASAAALAEALEAGVQAVECAR